MKCLLCIHGLLSSKNDFSFLIPNLKKYYDNVVALDIPGHGENELPFKTAYVKSYFVEKYDALSRKYEEIDVLGYSLGGVIACYLQSVRRVNKLILLAPAYRYLNLKNYHPQKKSKINLKVSQVLPRKKILHLFRFQKVVYDLSNEFSILYPQTLILWGDEDYLVKEESGLELYRMVHNRNRQYHIVQKHNHFNIVFSNKILYYIENFIA